MFEKYILKCHINLSQVGKKKINKKNKIFRTSSTASSCNILPFSFVYVYVVKRQPFALETGFLAFKYITLKSQVGINFTICNYYLNIHNVGIFFLF